MGGVGAEVGQAAGVEEGLALAPGGQAGAALRFDRPVQGNQQVRAPGSSSSWSATCSVKARPLAARGLPVAATAAMTGPGRPAGRVGAAAGMGAVAVAAVGDMAGSWADRLGSSRCGASKYLTIQN